MQAISAVWLAVATIPLAIWTYLLVRRGGFWRIGRHLPPKTDADAGAKTDSCGASVCAVIPARNEAEVVGSTIASLCHQRFNGRLQIVVVDDGSTDGTAETAKTAAEECGCSGLLTVLQAKPLPAGWTGKMWAVSQGVDVAADFAPDFLLLTDADIEHEPEGLALLIGISRKGGYDLVSQMVRLESRTLAERATIPAFVFFFFLLYPPMWIRDPRKRIAGAAGGCMLLRPRALAAAGGIAAIRGEVIDDCALARAIKQSGGSVWLGLAEQTHSLRSYKTFGEIEAMISRTAFNQLNHSGWLLAGTLLGLVITYALPVGLAFSGKPAFRLLGIAAWFLMSATYLPMIRFYRQNALWAITLPAVALFYATATLHSALKFWTGRGGEWKGRAQDVHTGQA